ncbi:MAG: acetyl-CoA hydrolase, partial [Tannerella sp.]|nr:acetyl-CoA hydrolase [Tannerella sp.]
MALKRITAEEAASFVKDGDNVGFSGFTPAGCPKVVPEAVAKRAEEEHRNGRPFSIGMFTGASTGDRLDGALARAKAVKFRTPYQSNKDLRNLINSGGTHYFDMHLSELAQDLRYGFLGKVDAAIVEAADITDEGEIILTEGVGIIPTVCRLADRIIIELNSFHPKEIRGMHDIYEPADPPLRREIPVYQPADRIGTPYLKVDPKKIVGVVETNNPNDGGNFTPLDDVTLAIGKNVSDFLVSEMKNGRIPTSFLPVQSGVGNVANAVLGAMGANAAIPAFKVYTEVIQDAVIKLMNEGRVGFASGCSLSVSTEVLKGIYSNLAFFKDKILLRPQEISNNPEIARRLGLITINTALEADIFGNINSTHVLGTKMMNGIGGSGDFTR